MKTYTFTALPADASVKVQITDDLFPGAKNVFYLSKVGYGSTTAFADQYDNFGTKNFLLISHESGQKSFSFSKVFNIGGNILTDPEAISAAIDALFPKANTTPGGGVVTGTFAGSNGGKYTLTIDETDPNNPVPIYTKTA